MSHEPFPHLEPLPTAWGGHLLSCDLCYDSEIEDIIRATIPWTAGLRPMYRDSRDGIIVCRKCAEFGAYLEINP